ncbi:NAD-dependent epimerase/dehydratase family protein [Dysgonomonas macrotermitis]|uniref:Nucleoside-diphosphate-sugar epimerase n=2 Tax=Dysgonomonas macrotermitis TaxID=1346286 RepID=A0A1M5ADD9_9BACT|nr:NAD(P)-dependent oxidoreductase [Dysgonomonas macrotermitis]SHF28165.1 Nucleoside-diphosphate-sugar epimerase [Dysgonomonas macrotermitis]
MPRMRIAITGAAGNLGTLLARRMVFENIDLNLLIHKKLIEEGLAGYNNTEIFKIDLAQPTTLDESLKNVDVIVHFAGVLFKSNPEKFLSETNTKYFRNLLDKAVEHNIGRIILISFPHVEGETSPEYPATGKLTGQPISMHAKTRLDEEKILFDYASKFSFEPVSLRVGMVYGKGILMIDAAQWFARHYLLGIWKTPTYIHLISKDDFAEAVTQAAIRPNISGIYHIGDDGIQTLQQFLDDITSYKKNHKPWRMPVWMIMTAARAFELFSAVFGTISPLTVDFIKIGMVSYYGDTTRMRKELLPTLRYKTYKEGIKLFD